MKSGLVFYPSFYEASQVLEEKERSVFYTAIIEFAFTGKYPNLSGTSKALFSLIEPLIIASKKRFENGKKGGRPKSMVTTSNKSMVISNNKGKTKGNQEVNKGDESGVIADNKTIVIPNNESMVLQKKITSSYLISSSLNSSNLNSSNSDSNFTSNTDIFSRSEKNQELEDEFNTLFSSYPLRAGGNSPVTGFRAWLDEIESGRATKDELRTAVLRYKVYLEAVGKIGTEYVLTAKAFFTDQHYKNQWIIPPPKPTDKPKGMSEMDMIWEQVKREQKAELEAQNEHKT